MANSALSSCQKELQKGEGIPSKLVIRLGTKQLTAHCESASPSASSQRESTQAVFSVHSLSGDLRNCLAYHAFTFLNQSKKKNCMQVHVSVCHAKMYPWVFPETALRKMGVQLHSKFGAPLL